MKIEGAQLKRQLEEMARNLWWTWHPEAIEVWRSIDPALWRECRHSPVVFLKKLDDSRLEDLARDPVVRIGISRVISELDRYLSCRTTWCTTNAGPLLARPVAYFSAEIGIHESLPLYSGGLGVLAGDHLKSASDLGVPTAGVSLFYREGYFRQRIGEDGTQSEEYEDLDPENLALRRVTGADGRPLTVRIPLQDENVEIGAWTVRLGRGALYFLDVESAFRHLGIQSLGSRLYAGDETVRLSQEYVLGVGGMRLLLLLGTPPGVIHLNEGHSALAPLEYARHLMEEHGTDFPQACRQAASRTVFTTHTPVPAGHDRFSSDLVGRLLWGYRESLGLSHERFMELGRVNPQDAGEPFCMTVLALRMSGKANAVSSIHGKVSRQMWSGVWSGRKPQEVPIGHITNGVNVLGWLAPAMKDLFNRHFPPGWHNRIAMEDTWRHIESIPDDELWNTMLLLKERLFQFIPQLPHRAHPAAAALDSRMLTIGFARRFAGYKRVELLLDDLERIWAMLGDGERPIQIVFSGKAHPQDSHGKELVRKVHQFATRPRFPGRVVLIEDYDINVCRHLVQGVDLWLNTPRQGYEASGTSGMKVALNAGLNLSVLDGWWPEGYDGSNGFAVRGSRSDDHALRDRKDREEVFLALEKEVVPEYYDQDERGVPVKWLQRVRRAMFTLGWRFSADRMVKDYVLHCYRPAGGISTSEMRGPFT